MIDTVLSNDRTNDGYSTNDRHTGLSNDRTNDGYSVNDRRHWIK